jgi:hypothetical protein
MPKVVSNELTDKGVWISDKLKSQILLISGEN